MPSVRICLNSRWRVPTYPREYGPNGSQVVVARRTLPGCPSTPTIQQPCSKDGQGHWVRLWRWWEPNHRRATSQELSSRFTLPLRNWVLGHQKVVIDEAKRFFIETEATEFSGATCIIILKPNTLDFLPLALYFFLKINYNLSFSKFKLNCRLITAALHKIQTYIFRVNTNAKCQDTPKVSQARLFNMRVITLRDEDTTKLY